MLFSMRVSMPDEPGALGGLASALGRAGANITALDVVHRGDGIAVDDLWVELDGREALQEGLRRAAEEVSGAVVEAVKPLGSRRVGSAMHLAASIVEAGDAGALNALVEGIPDALWATWAVALRKGDRPEVAASSLGAPSMSNVETPWLPLDRPRALPSAPWMPPGWCMGRMSYEVAAAPLGDPEAAILVARKHGPRFRPRELEELGLLCRILGSTRRSPALR